MTLCLNCLKATDHRPTPVGHETGHQWDPIQPTVQLCEACSDALVAGRFDLLHHWYRASREISRGGGSDG